MTEFSSEILNITLASIIKLLHKYSVSDWFICYGTLLGIARENSCIDQDDDIDIIVNEKFFDTILKMAAENNYKIILQNNSRFIKIQQSDNLPSIDFYMANINSANNSFLDKWENIRWTSVTPFVHMNFYDVILSLPNNYKSNLTNMYGDWHIKKKSKGFKPKPKYI